MKRMYSTDEARGVAGELGVDFATVEFDLDQFLDGLNVEAEHGEVSPETNVTNDDPLTTGRIALAHLNEIPDYYKRLRKMEADVDQTAPEVALGAGRGRKRILVVAMAGALALAMAGVVFVQVFRRRRS